jgi:tRNA (mo5U34)-methyltransferase
MINDISAQVAKYKWHHSIDLGNGVVTPGGKSLAVCTAEAHTIFDRIDLTGCTVLDIGAWNGLFSFEAKQRSASRVLATDSFCWTDPNLRGRETFDLVQSVLGLEVEAQEIDVAMLAPETVGMFDVVLFLGVFYHRRDAIQALTRISHLTKQVLVVETFLDLRHIDRPAMAFYPTTELKGDASNWWGPNEHFMKEFLLSLGFSEVEVSAHPTHNNRGIFHAWRSTEARTKSLPDAARLKPLIETPKKLAPALPTEKEVAPVPPTEEDLPKTKNLRSLLRSIAGVFRP